ncbi:MAG: hypothetical protein ACTSX2_00080 [Candidatus Thorarchaeota archaeon]
MIDKIIRWFRRLFRLYEKEIKEFVDDMLDLAFQNLDDERLDKLNPEIRKKVRNKVLADILIMGIDIGTIKGKSESGKIIMDAIDWFIKEGE